MMPRFIQISLHVHIYIYSQNKKRHKIENSECGKRNGFMVVTHTHTLAQSLEMMMNSGRTRKRNNNIT